MKVSRATQKFFVVSFLVSVCALVLRSWFTDLSNTVALVAMGSFLGGVFLGILERRAMSAD